MIRLLAGREPAQLSRVELAYLIDAHRARGEQHEALPLMRLYAARYRAPYR